MLAADPKNSFARYGLAMELVNTGNLERAATTFEELLAADPTYCAGYYHGGQTLEKLDRPDDARSMYRRGLEASAAKGDMHTHGEIQAALDFLG